MYRAASPNLLKTDLNPVPDRSFSSQKKRGDENENENARKRDQSVQAFETL